MINLVINLFYSKRTDNSVKELVKGTSAKIDYQRLIAKILLQAHGSQNTICHQKQDITIAIF